MSVQYVIDKERRLVITTASGRVTFDEFMAHRDQLASDPEFSPEFNQLLDGTRVTALEISSKEVGVIASRRVFAPESKRAFVATKPSVFGVARWPKSTSKCPGLGRRFKSSMTWLPP